MTCGGCSKAISTLVGKVAGEVEGKKRCVHVLKQLSWILGVEKVEANHETKVVKVTTKEGSDNESAVTEAIKKTGKAILEGPTKK
jgi:copper chaperone CopZ